jgi:3-oxoacyl-[acyl-carrier-protein] synthase II
LNPLVPSSTRRVAVTGCGIVCSLGRGIPSFLDSLRTGRRHLSRIRGVDTPRGKDLFAAADWPNSANRSFEMALAAIQEAVGEAHLSPEQNANVGVVLGTIWGDSQAAEDLFPQLSMLERPEAHHLAALRAYPAGRIVDAIATHFGFQGPRIVVSNACASGNIATGISLDLIRRGVCKVVIAAGVDRFSLTGLWGADRSGFLGRTLQPFDVDRKGTILGEGAAAIVLEDGATASQRSVKAWVEGYACVCEPGAAAITLQEDGIGIQMATRAALSDAFRTESSVDLVSAHAPGTPLIDLVECRAIRALWADPLKVPLVNATKSITGHMSGASAVAELIACVLQIQYGFVHANVGLERPDPELPVPVLGRSTVVTQVRLAISHACGGGGISTSVVVTDRDSAARIQRTPKEPPRVVITGFGALRAPASMVQSDSPDWFDSAHWFGTEGPYSQMSRTGRISAATGIMAVRRASLKLDGRGPAADRVAVLGGAWLGGYQVGSAALCTGLLHRPVQIFPSTTLDSGGHLGVMILCRQFGFVGPSHTICGHLDSALQAFALAFGLIREERASAAVVLGYDTDDAWLRRAANWMPECVILRDFVDGAGALVMEAEATARARGATALALVHGVAMVSGDLAPASVEDRGKEILSQLGEERIDRIVACSPVDEGLKILVWSLSRLTGAAVSFTGPTHSLSAEAIFSVELAARAERSLVLAGSNGSTQTAALVSPA